MLGTAREKSVKVGDLIYDRSTELCGVLVEEGFELDERPWIGMRWDFLVLYADGDLAGCFHYDLEVISEAVV